MGRYEEALILCQNALAIKSETLEEEHPDIVASYSNLGLIYFELTDYENALNYLNLASEIADKIWSGDFSFKADIYNDLGLVHRSLQKYDKAKEYYYKAQKVRKRYFPESHPLVLATHSNLAQVYASEGNHDKAVSYLEYVIKNYKSNNTIADEDSSFLGTVYNNLSNSYRLLGEYEKALSACNKGMSMREKVFGIHSLDYALSINNLGLIYYGMENLETAKANFEEALRIKVDLLPEVHEHLSTGYFNLAFIYDKMQQDDKALAYYRASMEINNELGLYESVLLSADYMADIHERNGRGDLAAEYRNLGNHKTSE